MLDSDRYIIDVDQLDCDVGGAACISNNNSALVPVSSSTSNDYLNPPTSDHMIPISDHVTARRSGGDIIKLLKMTSSKDHVTSE